MYLGFLIRYQPDYMATACRLVWYIAQTAALYSRYYHGIIPYVRNSQSSPTTVYRFHQRLQLFFFFAKFSPPIHLQHFPSHLTTRPTLQGHDAHLSGIVVPAKAFSAVIMPPRHSASKSVGILGRPDDVSFGRYYPHSQDPAGLSRVVVDPFPHWVLAQSSLVPTGTMALLW